MFTTNWIVIATLTAACWGLMYMLAGKILLVVDKNVYLFMCSFVNMAAFFIFADKTKFSIPWNGWLLLIGISAITIVANYLSVYAIQLSDPVRAASVEITYPLWCMMFSLLFCSNVSFSWRTILAMLFIMVGMVMFVLDNNSH